MFKSLFSRKPVLDTPQALPRAVELQAQGKFAEAEAICRAILKFPGDQFDAARLLGALLLQQSRFDEARQCFAQVLAQTPKHFGALTGLGDALAAEGQSEAALATYREALSIQPASAGVRHAVALALLNLGRPDQALREWDQVLGADPAMFAASIGRGSALNALGRNEEALSEFDRAIELAPYDSNGHYNRAVVQGAMGRIDEALASYELALAITPDHTRALFNCAVLQSGRSRHAEALANFEQILLTDPDYPQAIGNVALEKARICDWRDWEAIVRRVDEGVAQGKQVIVPFAYLALSDSAERQCACAARTIADRHPASQRPLWSGQRHAHDKIRVAYLSADFQEHAVSYLIAGLFENHDRQRFEITGVGFGPDIRCRTRDRIEAACDRSVDIRNMSDADAAALLHNLEIDIAVDLMGFTQHARTGIFARRPAPVQVNYLGYPASMGAGYLDYILADPFVIPEALRKHYTESVVYLPDTFQVNDSKRRIAEATPTRASVGLGDDAFVFCSFNSSLKITPTMFSLWMRLLSRVPGSVLWLIAGNPDVEANLRREAQTRGIAPERLVFARRMAYPEHLARYRLADLFLDTLPFNGGATVSDALWAGLPALTCAGEAFAARMAGSLLHAVGLPELVTYSLADYESLAMQLATEPARIAGLKQRLTRNRDTHPLFDTNRFTRNLEAAYLAMWERTQRGQAPSDFAVSGS